VVCCSSVSVLGTAASSAKPAGPTEMPSGEQTQRTACSVFARVHTGATCRIRQVDLCGGGDAACRYHFVAICSICTCAIVICR